MYKVYEVDEKTSQKGNPYKKLVLQKEGDQYPKKGVTMFSDHPNFTETVPGYQLDCELKEEDSGTPNPKAPGKNYINRTVLNPGQAAEKPSQLDAINTGKIDQIYAMVAAIHKEVVKDTVGDTNVEYPHPTDEIKPEDVPF